MSQLQEKPSALKRKQPALQIMKFTNFSLCLWVNFALLDPDPDWGSGYGSRDHIESGSNPHPDPDPGTPFNPDPIRFRIRIQGPH